MKFATSPQPSDAPVEVRIRLLGNDAISPNCVYLDARSPKTGCWHPLLKLDHAGIGLCSPGHAALRGVGFNENAIKAHRLTARPY